MFIFIFTKYEYQIDKIFKILIKIDKIFSIYQLL